MIYFLIGVVIYTIVIYLCWLRLKTWGCKEADEMLETPSFFIFVSIFVFPYTIYMTLKELYYYSSMLYDLKRLENSLKKLQSEIEETVLEEKIQ